MTGGYPAVLPAPAPTDCCPPLARAVTTGPLGSGCHRTGAGTCRLKLRSGSVPEPAPEECPALFEGRGTSGIRAHQCASFHEPVRHATTCAHAWLARICHSASSRLRRAGHALLKGAAVRSPFVTLASAVAALVAMAVWRGKKGRPVEKSLPAPVERPLARPAHGLQPRNPSTVGYEVVAVELPSTPSSPRPTVPTAWFAFVSGTIVAGPFDDANSADRAGESSGERGSSLDVDCEPGWSASVRAVYRRDLSPPPCHLWEFTSAGSTFFAVIGPGGWVGPATWSATAALSTATRQAESLRGRSPDSKTDSGSAA